MASFLTGFHAHIAQYDPAVSRTRVSMPPASGVNHYTTHPPLPQADELTEDGLVLRYMNDEGLNADGLSGEEGTFTICSFWLVACLAQAGEVDRAEELFGRLTGYANDLGLLAEEIDTANDEQLGNFPQAFSHIGLVNAAWAISQAEKRRAAAGPGAVRAAARAAPLGPHAAAGHHAQHARARAAARGPGRRERHPAAAHPGRPAQTGGIKRHSRPVDG